MGRRRGRRGREEGGKGGRGKRGAGVQGSSTTSKSLTQFGWSIFFITASSLLPLTRQCSTVAPAARCALHVAAVRVVEPYSSRLASDGHPATPSLASDATMRLAGCSQAQVQVAAVAARGEASPGADVAGASPVQAQVWASPGAGVGESQRRWVGRESGWTRPNADAGPIADEGRCPCSYRRGASPGGDVRT